MTPGADPPPPDALRCDRCGGPVATDLRLGGRDVGLYPRRRRAMLLPVAVVNAHACLDCGDVRLQLDDVSPLRRRASRRRARRG